MTNRRLLAYFFESQVWKKFLEGHVKNYAYWVNEDPKRAQKMFAARTNGKLGITVEEYLCDILECIHNSNLKPTTKAQLYDELSELESYHKFKKTLQQEM